MLDRLSSTLKGLRSTFSGATEQAYRRRDDADSGSQAEAYAAGEAHAYGEAEDQVLTAEKTDAQTQDKS